MTDFTLWHGDCLEEMSRIEAGSVDAIICDLPYGTTACKWDIVIPFEPLWKQYKRVIKKRGAVVLFGSQPFTSLLVMSNLEWFKYCWIWEKDQGGNFAHANNKPLKSHEDICIFSDGTTVHKSQSMMRMTYNPQGLNKINKIKNNRLQVRTNTYFSPRKSHVDTLVQIYGNYPRSVLKVTRERGLHPTQKPVALLSYLIKTYTNEGDTVLDSTCGSGSTLEAAMRNNRRSIGIEKDAHYFSVAQQRLERVAAELRGELGHLPMFAEVT